jgi:autotransporter-associated beta strand protein
LTFGGTNGGTISGALQNNTGANFALTVAKIGSGTWTLGGTNTYTGNTDVNAGTLRLQSGATTITQTLGALRSQSADGTLISNKSGAGNLTTTFSSYTRSAGATGNIVSTGGTNGTDNSVNITGAAGFINAGLYFGGSDFAARNATDGYVRALNYATTGGDTNTVDVDTVTASRHVKIATTSYSGAGMTLLSLNLAGGGINWTNTSGNLSTPGILKSGGGSQSTISGGNVATPSNVELVIRTDTSSDSLLITSNLTHGGGALTKSGAGTLTLSGTSSTFTGQTHINAGTLSISSNANLGAQTTGATLNLKGGTLQATGTFGLFNGTAGTNNRAVTLLNQSTIEVTVSNTLTIAGVMSNLSSVNGTTGGFNKTGTGTLLLSGSNTYTGVTTVSQGTLFVNNTTGSGTGSGVVNVGVNGTLGGNGIIAGATTIEGFLNPGNSPGVLRFSNALTLAATATSTFEIDGLARGTAFDGVDIGGDFAMGGALLFDIGTVFTEDATFLFFDVAGSRSGDFSSVGLSGDMGSGSFTFNSGTWSLSQGVNQWSFMQNTGTLSLTVIPEPSAALLGGLGLLAMLRRRRK